MEILLKQSSSLSSFSFGRMLKDTEDSEEGNNQQREYCWEKAISSVKEKLIFWISMLCHLKISECCRGNECFLYQSVSHFLRMVSPSGMSSDSSTALTSGLYH